MLAARLRLVFAEPSEGIWTTSTFSIADNGRKSKGVDGTTAAVRTADSALIYDANRNLTILEGPKRMVYIGGIYEKNLDTGEVTKYYHTADGRRLAMRKGSTLSYFANDHLGGTAVVMNASGDLVSRVRYLPYGNQWTQETGAPPTDRLFTGQRRYGAKSGIYHYGARFCSADIGRFLQADSIVPEAANPQDLNRYTYVRNNPVNHTDPTGHCIADSNCPGDENRCRGGGGICNTVSNPVVEALKVVPIRPYGIDRIIAGCKFCAFHDNWLRKRTWEAVETLHDAGWQLHMLPWGDRSYVAELVRGMYGKEALEPWYDTPSPSEMKEYMLGGVAVAAVGSGGLSTLFTPGGSYVDQAGIGTMWKQFQSDWSSGQGNQWRIETVTAAARDSRLYANQWD
jgi:RHS repeat-associated protein